MVENIPSPRAIWIGVFRAVHCCYWRVSVTSNNFQTFGSHHSVTWDRVVGFLNRGDKQHSFLTTFGYLGRKGIWPVKIVSGGVRCRFAYGPADATATHSSYLAPVIPDWFYLAGTQVVPDKRPLSRCCCILCKNWVTVHNAKEINLTCRSNECLRRRVSISHLTSPNFLASVS